MRDNCPFCKRIAAGEYDRELSPNGLQAVFAPLNPVIPGHLLVVPWEHIESAAADPKVAGAALGYAARIVQHFGYNANIITSVGPDATQTVFHMHVHIVPRHAGDGLHLPWTGQKPAEAAA